MCLGLKLDFFERELRSGDPKREKAAQQTLVKEVCPELGWLREYVVLNYTAVVKAVKKGNKNLGHSTQAVQLLAGEPIFSSLGLANLVERAEMLTVHAAPASERKIADYVCPLCDEVLSNPVMLPCEHRFCFKCITNVKHTNRDGSEDEHSRRSSMEKLVDDETNQSDNNHDQDRWSKGALHRGACPVCREPNMNDESSLRVDDKLDEFIKTHFTDAALRSEQDLHVLHKESSEESMRDAHSPSSIPKALIIVVAGCRSDAMLVSDAPTMSSFVRGSGCFSFHMQHTWNGCGNTSSDAMMPLLTGSQGASLFGAPGAEKVYKKKDGPGSLSTTSDVQLSSVFSRLAEVRSWVKVVAAIGGAPDLASTIAAENAAEVCTSSTADDSDAARVATRALTNSSGEDVIYLHLSGVQDAGAVHGYGPHVTEYRKAVEQADALITDVIGALRERQRSSPQEDWLVVISSPAGGTTRADMPVTMQGHFDAADWSGGGGRQLRAAGVTGFESLPQHATGWVLVDMPAEPGFAGGCMNERRRACGELLPPPSDVDVAPTLLEHFGVAPRREWGLDGNHLLVSRRTDTVREEESRNRPSSHYGRDEITSHAVDMTNSNDGSDTDMSHHSNASDMSVDKNFDRRVDIEGTGSAVEFIASNIAAAPNRVGSSQQNGYGFGVNIPPKLGKSLSAPGPFASHLPGLFEPTGCAVVGHRGFGMNRTPGRGIRENTVASFIAAHGSGAGWCEFDVQVTSDGVPVLFHDNLLLVRYGFGPVQALSIRELDLAELKAMSRAAIATAKAAFMGVPEAVAAAAGLDKGPFPSSKKSKSFSKLNKKQILEDDEDEEDEDAPVIDVPVVFYRKFPASAGNPPTPLPWIMDVEDEIPTLEELMTHAPPELGLSMELKFDEQNPCATPRLVAELRAVLALCRQHPTRRILFSSFDPDAALIMRALQGLYPVMMISDCAPHHVDPRRRTVAAAKKCALEGGLCGLELNVKVLADGPDVADDVRSSGLLLGTYGEENDDKPLASKQVEWGMCLVCTDNVAALAGLFNAGNEEVVSDGENKLSDGNGSDSDVERLGTETRDPAQSPGREFANSARRLLGESELDAVRNAPWYKLSEDGKKEHAHETKLKSTGVPLAQRRTASSEFLKEHRRKPEHFLGRIGTVEALSALEHASVSGQKVTGVVSSTGNGSTVSKDSPSAANRNPSSVHVTQSTQNTLTDRQPKAGDRKRNGPSQRAGVTSKGYWAMFPKYMPAPRGAADGAAAAKVTAPVLHPKIVPHP